MGSDAQPLRQYSPQTYTKWPLKPCILRTDHKPHLPMLPKVFSNFADWINNLLLFFGYSSIIIFSANNWAIQSHPSLWPPYWLPTHTFRWPRLFHAPILAGSVGILTFNSCNYPYTLFSNTLTKKFLSSTPLAPHHASILIIYPQPFTSPFSTSPCGNCCL